MRGGACVFFFKRKTAYERRISDWSSDVCTSGLEIGYGDEQVERMAFRYQRWSRCVGFHRLQCIEQQIGEALAAKRRCEPAGAAEIGQFVAHFLWRPRRDGAGYCVVWLSGRHPYQGRCPEFGELADRPRVWLQQQIHIGIFQPQIRSEEHTSEL